MDQKYLCIGKGKNTKNANKSTRHPLFILSRAFFLEPYPSEMNMTNTIESSLKQTGRLPDKKVLTG